MKKAFNITGMALTLIFAIVIFYYMDEVDSARSSSYLSSYSNYSSYSDPYSYSSPYSSSYSSYSDSYEEITEEAGVVSLFFLLFFLAIFLINLLKLKTKTVKILSIIGLSLTGIWLIWDFLMISDGGALSFDEVGPGFLFYNFIVMAFTIVGTIHAFRESKMIHDFGNTGADILG